MSTTHLGCIFVHLILSILIFYGIRPMKIEIDYEFLVLSMTLQMWHLTNRDVKLILLIWTLYECSHRILVYNPWMHITCILLYNVTEILYQKFALFLRSKLHFLIVRIRVLILQRYFRKRQWKYLKYLYDMLRSLSCSLKLHVPINAIKPYKIYTGAITLYNHTPQELDCTHQCYIRVYCTDIKTTMEKIYITGLTAKW